MNLPGECVVGKCASDCGPVGWPLVSPSSTGPPRVSSATRVLVATVPVDLRGSFNRLYSLVVEQLKENPLSGHLFVFTNRRHNRLKVRH
jgi:transposase